MLIVNCSIFNPTPSLSAMIVNHFKMRSNVVTYNLGGMGCSAGIIAISLARELLQVPSRPFKSTSSPGLRLCETILLTSLIVLISSSHGILHGLPDLFSCANYIHGFIFE